MKRLFFAASVALIPTLLIAPVEGQAPQQPAAAPKPAVSHTPATPVFGVAEQNALVKQYCTGCHSDRGKAGQLTLASFDAAKAADPDHLATTEKMIRKLRAGMMPPAGAKRPDDAQLSRLASALEARMDALAGPTPDPGWRPLQRLNRAEYARSVQQLVGLDVDVTAFLPADTISNGFDNRYILQSIDISGATPGTAQAISTSPGSLAKGTVGVSNCNFVQPTCGSSQERKFRFTISPVPATANAAPFVIYASDETSLGKFQVHVASLDGNTLFGSASVASPSSSAGRATVS